MGKWLEGLKSSAGMITGVVAAVTIGYGVIVKAGWVIGRAEAQTMITLAVQQASEQVSTALADESKARRLADLQFQKTLAEQAVAELLDIEERTPGEEYELERAKKLVDQLDSGIAELQP